MRALAFSVLLMTLPAALGACAVDASSPVSEEDRGEVRHDIGTSAGASNPPVESEGTSAPIRTVQSHKQGADPTATKPSEEPGPTPWKGGGNGDGSGSSGGGKGAQKKDGDLHTKMRDSIVPDDGTHP